MTALGINFKPGYRYRKAGVAFLDLVPAGYLQRGVFDQPDDARSLQRMRAIDRPNTRLDRRLDRSRCLSGRMMFSASRG
jgi:hypothetical protein